MPRLRDFDTVQNEISELNPILVRKKNEDKITIWVEGDDWRLYSRFFIKDKVECKQREGGFSCHAAVEKYREFKKQFPNKLALVIKDADFHRVNNNVIDDEPDIFYADGHDHEMMCFSQQYVREILMRDFEYDKDSELFFDGIFKELLNLSYIKWYNFNLHGSYNFGTLGDLYTIKKATFEDIDKLNNDIICRTNSELRKNGLKTISGFNTFALLLFQKWRSNSDRYEITNGHDFCNRLNYHLSKINNKIKLSEYTLKGHVYSTFTPVFKNTKLFKDLAEWSKRNNVEILEVI